VEYETWDPNTNKTGSTIWKEWTTPDFQNTPSTTNLEEEEIVDALENDGNTSMPEKVNRLIHGGRWRWLQNFYLFIPQFFTEYLPKFCRTLIEKHRIKCSLLCPFPFPFPFFRSCKLFHALKLWDCLTPSHEIERTSVRSETIVCYCGVARLVSRNWVLCWTFCSSPKLKANEYSALLEWQRKADVKVISLPECHFACLQS